MGAPRRFAVIAALLGALVAGQSQAAPKKPRVVVLSVKPIDEETRRSAEILTEIVLTDLSKVDRLEILGESEVGSMLGFERRKALLGCNDAGCLAEIGGALGGDFLLMGTLGRFGKQLRLDLKLADVRKSQVLSREGATVDSTDDLAEAARSSIKALLAPFLRRLDRKASGPAAGPLESRSGSRGPLGWSLVAGGGALLLGGGVLTGVTMGAKRNLTFDQTQTRSSAGLCIGAVGLAALVSAVVVFAVMPGAPPGPATPSLTLTPSGNGASLVASGTFW